MGGPIVGEAATPNAERDRDDDERDDTNDDTGNFSVRQRSCIRQRSCVARRVRTQAEVARVVGRPGGARHARVYIIV